MGWLYVGGEDIVLTGTSEAEDADLGAFLACER